LGLAPLPGPSLLKGKINNNNNNNKIEKQYYYYWRETIDLIWKIKLKTIRTWIYMFNIIIDIINIIIFIIINKCFKKYYY
jgi:hypothetical protein